MAGSGPPARLSVFVARSAPVAVILRRGPSKLVQMVRWDMAAGTFMRGEWLRGRVYAEGCDISPDGTKFIYNAADYRIGARPCDCWTGLCAPPSWSPLVYWPMSGNFRRGGFFVDDRTVELDPWGHKANTWGPIPFEGGSVEAAPVQDAPSLPWRRLERDGWSLQSGVSVLEPGAPSGAELESVWRKARPKSRMALDVTYLGLYERSNCTPRSTCTPCVREFRITGPGASAGLPLPGAAWADWDRKGRLLFARDGRLFKGSIRDGAVAETLLIDLNGGVHQHGSSQIR